MPVYFNKRSVSHAAIPQSIANSEIPAVVEKPDFFIPSFRTYKNIQRLAILTVAIVIFLTILEVLFLQDTAVFLPALIENIIFFVIYIVLAVMGVEVFRSRLKQLDERQATIVTWLILLTATVIASILSLVVLDMLDRRELQVLVIVLEASFNTLLIGISNIFMLHYLVLQHRAVKRQYAYFQNRTDEMAARIAPHFFFNTLNTLMGLIETKPEQAGDMVQSLSQLYRASFSDAHEIPLEDELKICDNYLSIEMKRLPDRLNVSWQLPDEDTLYDMTIIKMTLQNIIEQHVQSAVETSHSPTTMSINIQWTDNKVLILVQTELPDGLPEAFVLPIHELPTLRLQSEFGDDASIGSYTQDNYVLKTLIEYPFADLM